MALQKVTQAQGEDIQPFREKAVKGALPSGSTLCGPLPRNPRMAAAIGIIGGSGLYEIEGFGKQLRADVQAHLSLPHALFGWNAAVELPADASLAALRVSGVDDEGVVTPFGFSGSVSGS